MGSMKGGMVAELCAFGVEGWECGGGKRSMLSTRQRGEHGHGGVGKNINISQPSIPW